MTQLARARVLAAAAAGCSLLAVTCGSPTQPGTTIVIPAPAIACPAAPSPATIVSGQSTLVSYGAPTVTGGTTPVSASCTPPSGSSFNAGSTTVTCTATDAVHRTASCSFAVVVTTPTPRLGVTRILAFGDSITEGEVPVAGEFPTLSIRPRYVELPSSYPADLTTLLALRYVAQPATRLDALTLFSDNSTDCSTNPPAPTTSGILVINAGCEGERAEDPGTLARLNSKIAAYHPDLVLLLEGTNDLDPSNPATSIANGVQGMQRLVGAVRNTGAPVMVGTILPQIAADLTHGGAPSLVVPFNTQLVPAVTAAGAIVVDLYSDIATDVTDWISPFDGLHPTAAGYQEIARVFFGRIESTFEVQPPAAVTTSIKARR